MKSYDADMTLAWERHANLEEFEQMDEDYAVGMLQAHLPGFRVWRNEMTGSFTASREGRTYASDCPEALLAMCREDKAPDETRCRQPGCTRPATTEYTAGWAVCEACSQMMSR